MCGGNRRPYQRRVDARGLSPRVRGKPPRNRARVSAGRSIPACAGETATSDCDCRANRVYPRVCGGNGHPRRPVPARLGLSPRVRGKPGPMPHLRDKGRSIPACAGETPGAAGPPQSKQVYPRVCGGNDARRRNRRVACGLSPRVRGKPTVSGLGRCLWRSIPACAGETFQVWYSAK